MDFQWGGTDRKRQGNMVEVMTFNQLFLQRQSLKLTIENINQNSDQYESCIGGQYNLRIDQNFDLCLQSLVLGSNVVKIIDYRSSQMSDDCTASIGTF